LLSALAARFVGRAIDRFGGRIVLCVGSLIAAIALFAISRVHSAVNLYLAWSLAGIAMAMTMYDAAFATLSQHTGATYRTALTALTLMGGLASTVFWPVSLKGLEWFGWRETFAGFAALQLAVCLPLHFAFVPGHTSLEKPGSIAVVAQGGSLPAQSRRTAFAALAVAFAFNGFIVSVLTVHLISVLQGKGLTLEGAVWVASFFGPMQVAGRIVEFSIGRKSSPRTIGAVSLWLLVIALLVLLSLDGQVALALLFAVAFGCSNGVVTIVRGTVPAELFGRTGYGSTLGSLAAPALFARAVAPFAFAPLASPQTASFGWLLVLLAMALASVAAFAIAVRKH
jgi:MFS family permease